MIRLIASDLDGTLLPDHDTPVSERMFTQIRELREKGVLFCAASGRQYQSLRRLFAPVLNEIGYVCENGSIVYYQDQVIGTTLIPYQDAMELIAQINAQENCEALISGVDSCYIFEGNRTELTKALEINNNKFTVINSASELPTEIIKISIHAISGAAPYEPIFSPIWKDRLSVAIAGEQWLDFTLADKGIGLSQIANTLGIDPSEFMVFGDNFNDLGMFRFAGVSYAMEKAHPDVQEKAHLQCSCVEDVIQKEFNLSV